MIGKKILTTIVVFALLFSTMVVINQVTNFKIIGNAGATTIDISDDGSRTVGGNPLGLTCGEAITIKVVDGSLNASEKYYVKVWTGSSWASLKIDGNTKSDSYGNLMLTVRVPGWSKIGANPLGTWNISLFDKSGTWQIAGTNTSILISNLYDVRYYHDGAFIDNIIYNTTYNYFWVYVYNWTGSGYVLLNDETLSISVCQPDGPLIGPAYAKTGVTTGKTDFDISRQQTIFDDSGNYEYYMWVNVTNEDSTNSYSNATLPVKLDVTTTLPTTATWGDTINADGFIYDGQGNAVPNYPVYLYTPIDGGYYPIQSGTTMSSGRYSFSVQTGSGPGKSNYGSAGTWYVGTQETGGTYRINESDTLDIDDFLSYGSFEVDTKDTAAVAIATSTDIISGFVQTINVSVANASWMKEDEFKNMYIHVTGLKSWYAGVEYDDNDIVMVADSTNITRTNDQKAWYEFEWRFNETGSAQVWASWPGNLTSIAKEGPLTGETGTYSNRYSNMDLLANITGHTTLPVVSPAGMNLVIDGTMVEEVQVTEITAYGSNAKWQNGSDYFIIKIYGDSQDDAMNATLEITGCGLDILINESDTAAENKYLNDKGDGWYNVTISPKTAGTLTIVATNETDNETASKDFTIKGLLGSVTSSVGDDLEIEVESQESITLTVTNGAYAQVVLTLFDENWVAISNVNYTTGDGTAGNGANGEFEFNPDEDYLDEIGFIVCVAKAGGYYMYDIVEIAPVHDLNLSIITPDIANQTLTVGIEQSITLEVTGPDGEIIEDIDTVIGKLYNEDDKLKQTLTFGEDGDQWTLVDQIIWYPGTLKITAKNNTGENEHDGTVNLISEPATFTFSPGQATAGIDAKNITVTFSGVDANGYPIPDGTTAYLNTDAGGTTLNKGSVSLDSDGAGEFKITAVGDKEGTVNITFEAPWVKKIGNETLGQFNIDFPYFVIEPDTIYINQPNTVEIWAYKADKITPIPYLNLSLWGKTITQPEPAETDDDGNVIFSLEPQSSGKANVTIVRNVSYDNQGILQWTNDVITSTYLTITALRALKIGVSKSPIYEAETLTITITSGESAVKDVDVTFGIESAKTGTDGKVTFTVPDPGVDSAIYEISASKVGYITATKSITVINKWDITIVGPSGKIEQGKKYTFTIIAKGSPLAGAIITFNGKTYTSGGDGKISLTMPDKIGDYTISATFPNYLTATLTIKIVQGSPGFELLTLIIALGVALILLRRRRK